MLSWLEERVRLRLSIEVDPGRDSSFSSPPLPPGSEAVNARGQDLAEGQGAEEERYGSGQKASC